MGIAKMQKGGGRGPQGPAIQAAELAEKLSGSAAVRKRVGRALGDARVEQAARFRRTHAKYNDVTTELRALEQRYKAEHRALSIRQSELHVQLNQERVAAQEIGTALRRRPDWLA